MLSKCVVIRKTPEKSVMQDARDFYIDEIGTVIEVRDTIVKLKFDDNCSVWFKSDEVRYV